MLKALLLLSAFLPLQEVPAKREVAIQLLNGKSGKPLTGQRILIFGGSTPEEAGFHETHFEVKTDATGLARITFDPKQTQFIEVFVDFMTVCDTKGNKPTFDVKAIVETGFAESNTCGSAKAKLQPGRLVVFARSPTLREKMAW